MLSEKYASYHTAETMQQKNIQNQMMSEYPTRDLSAFVLPPDSSEPYVQIDWAYSHFFSTFVQSSVQQ